jgi:hypothetical protein
MEDLQPNPRMLSCPPARCRHHLVHIVTKIRLAPRMQKAVPVWRQDIIYPHRARNSLHTQTKENGCMQIRSDF